ncbi:MAG: hypothetical protein Q8Q33_09735 [Chlamydiota bacterium]|nr:hypothetical protein [Chlamydiota bacterium]
MNKKVLLIFFYVVSFFYLTTSIHAGTIPQTEKDHAVKCSKRAIDSIIPIEAKELVDDIKFLQLLQRILQDKTFSESDKVDAFYLMLKKIGWSFTGGVRIPYNSSYFQVFMGQAKTYLLYQKALDSLQYNITGLLDISKKDIKENVVRASYALLLSAILDYQKTSETINYFIDAEKIQRVQVPSILLHNLAFSTILTRNYQVASKFGKLLDKIQSEEEREDILCTLGIFATEITIEQIKSFLKNRIDVGYDLSVETAIFALKARLSPLDFKNFYSEYLISTNSVFHKRLEDLEKNGFNSSLLADIPIGQTFYKTWDGFDIAIYDDGIVLSFKDQFSEYKEKEF